MIDIIEYYNNNATIDNDFDEVFYLKEYPDTINFYQPYCKDNKIDDRHRLFYHYKFYGFPYYFKNQIIKNESSFESKISKRNIPNNNKLAIITTFFNPCDYVNLKYNYSIFSNKIQQYGDLFPIELSLNNNFFIENPNVTRISGDQSNILWQKETLLNIVLNEIPGKYTDVAWIDCDIIFNNIYWPKQLFDMLNRYKIIQLFSNGYRLDQNALPQNKFTSIIQNYPYGVTGFAWAARREILNDINFLDNQILGGADFIMASAFMNKPKILDRLNGYINNEHTQTWLKNTTQVIDQSVSYLNNEITHMYHGDISNRNYSFRYNSISNIDIETQCKKNNHIWQWSTPQPQVLKYFYSRSEDDNILDVNEYFDKIYVINLDKDTNKMLNTSQLLKKNNILYTRFSAVDGDSLVGENFNKYEKGCLLSHLNVIQDAYDHKYEKILIFEDDVKLCRNFHTQLQSLRSIEDWKLVYFGSSQHNWNDIEYKDQFYYAKNSLGTFAYAIDQSIYLELIELISRTCSELSIDKILSLVQYKHYKSCYVFYPNICIADTTTSSIREPRNQILHNEKMRWNIYTYDR